MSYFSGHKFISDLTEEQLIKSIKADNQTSNNNNSVTMGTKASTATFQNEKIQMLNIDKLGDIKHLILTLIQHFNYENSIKAIEQALEIKEENSIKTTKLPSSMSPSITNWDKWTAEINMTFKNDKKSSKLHVNPDPGKEDKKLDDNESMLNKLILELKKYDVKESCNSPNVFILTENKNKGKSLEKILKDEHMILCKFKSNGKLTAKTVDDLFKEYSVILTTPAILQNLLVADSSKVKSVKLVLNTCVDNVSKSIITKVKNLISNLPEEDKPDIVEMDLSDVFSNLEKITEKKEYYWEQKEYYPMSKSEEIRNNPNVTVTTKIFKKTLLTQDQVYMNKEEIKYNKSVQILNYELNQLEIDFCQELSCITSRTIQNIQNTSFFKSEEELKNYNFEELSKWSDVVYGAAQQHVKFKRNEMSVLNSILNLTKFTYIISEMVKEIGINISKYYISYYVIKLTKEIKPIIKNSYTENLILDIYKMICTDILKLIPDLEMLGHEPEYKIFNLSLDSNRILKLIELLNQYKNNSKLSVIVIIKKIENISIIKKILDNSDLTAWLHIEQYIENAYKDNIFENVIEIKMTDEAMKMSLLNFNRFNCSLMLVNVLKCPLSFLNEVNNFDMLIKYGDNLDDVSDFETFAKYRKLFKI